jgi:hypothetical protein
MEVNDGIEEPKTEELAPEHTLEDVGAGDAPTEDAATGQALEVPAWMRLAYAIEFLLALIAIVVLWSEVGGQGHMDLLPWYSKLSCVLAFAWCCVRFTAAMVELPQTWNRRSIGWFAGIILVGITMAGITFYYHLHEVPDETDSEDTTSASVIADPSVNTHLEVLWRGGGGGGGGGGWGGAG